jgi:ubiquinone/menaquinone biosynthesis C-methylase UbiE
MSAPMAESAHLDDRVEPYAAPRVEFTVADLVDLPLADGSVDLIVSTASLHHWTDAGAVIASLARVLRPDGRMWIYDLRPVPAGSVRAASSDLGRRVDRSLVRTGWFPAALFQPRDRAGIARDLSPTGPHVRRLHSRS